MHQVVGLLLTQRGHLTKPEEHWGVYVGQFYRGVVRPADGGELDALGVAYVKLGQRGPRQQEPVINVLVRVHSAHWPVRIRSPSRLQEFVDVFT